VNVFPEPSKKNANLCKRALQQVASHVVATWQRLFFEKPYHPFILPILIQTGGIMIYPVVL
jgi:hypothetical protein